MAAGMINYLTTHFHNTTPVGSAIRLPLRLMPKGIPVRIRSGAAKGMLWQSGALTHGCWLGTYEKDKQYFFTKTIKIGMMAYDIGANVGFHSLIMSRLVGYGKVVAFEPDSGNMALLRRHIALNEIENVTMVQAAVSDATSITGFSTKGGATCGLENNNIYLVPTMRLDEVVGQGGLERPDIIKIDVEGAEDLVLAGAGELIASRKSIWIVATHNSGNRSKCLDIFREAGYSIENLHGHSIDVEEFYGDEFVALPE